MTDNKPKVKQYIKQTRWTLNQLENMTVDEFDNLIEDIESDLGDYTASDVENTGSGVENIQDCVSIRIPANILEESQEIEHSHLNDGLLPSVNNLDPDSSDDDACSVEVRSSFDEFDS
ncbi:hypothetical protein JTB14_023580 [Gonioctena quinquepunctata]|nr:hypothetical protein JTB14_023580 [Gonioctena quinquepunctata]